MYNAAIRALLIPLSIQQSKSAEYMKALKPYIAEISVKFKGNEDAKNRAVGRLYQDADQNPLAGCLVSLVQLPVFLGLYRGVRLLALDNELNEPFLWIPSLEGPVSAPDFRGLDWLTSGWHEAAASGGGLPEPPLGWETTIAFLIMPVVLVVLQSITMNSLQPPIDDNAGEAEKEQLQSTQRILKFLPLMIGFFSLQVPAGLTIYWFTSNIFTLTQSLAVKAYFAANPPKIELPEYWDQALSGDTENMSPEERRRASEAGIRVGPTMDDLVAESRFHSYVERTALRPSATEPVPTPSDLPAELAAWMKQSGGMSVTTPSPATKATTSV
jgi:YidC/Oxa1 family membrane protein insertase